MHRWDKAPAIPSILYLLGRLPGEVCNTPHNTITRLTHCRILIATIRDYGLFPCPRCLIPKDEIFKIGRDDDRRAREELRRADTVERQGRVERVRTDLYENGYAFSGDHVDGALKDGSLVPTKVRQL